ncbi:hypothetical protein PIB30_050691 [Stylosanthes scabra]|uniref:Uncharacterized protein n=1 Tax=Stylosanthes scabra TaxID=79078 RepID=A0ABU6SHY0_9FABA|nr:hypothetical protein [Stylosanthes scabra]
MSSVSPTSNPLSLIANTSSSLITTLSLATTGIRGHLTSHILCLPNLQNLNLGDRGGKKKKYGGSKSKNSIAPHAQRILLGSSKRIFQARFSSCKEGQKDKSKKEVGGTAREVRDENISEVEVHSESEMSDEAIEETKNTIHVCQDAGMIFDNVDQDMLLRDILNTSRTRRSRQHEKHGT